MLILLMPTAATTLTSAYSQMCGLRKRVGRGAAAIKLVQQQENLDLASFFCFSFDQAGIEVINL